MIKTLIRASAATLLAIAVIVAVPSTVSAETEACWRCAHGAINGMPFAICTEAWPGHDGRKMCYEPEWGTGGTCSYGPSQFCSVPCENPLGCGDGPEGGLLLVLSGDGTLVRTVTDRTAARSGSTNNTGTTCSFETPAEQLEASIRAEYEARTALLVL